MYINSLFINLDLYRMAYNEYRKVWNKILQYKLYNFIVTYYNFNN
jgi:hypothetical protein